MATSERASAVAARHHHQHHWAFLRLGHLAELWSVRTWAEDLPRYGRWMGDGLEGLVSPGNRIKASQYRRELGALVAHTWDEGTLG